MEINIEDQLMILRFKSEKYMNQILDPISNSYEGIISNRLGHNFPIEFVPDNHILSPYKKNVKYIVAVANHKHLAHELLHAKFYLDEPYREKIINEYNQMNILKKTHINLSLKKMSYPEDKWIDEYQAYTYSEKDNFWGFNKSSDLSLNSKYKNRNKNKN